ncbi:MAG: DUF4159 domain-containing protein [Bacteroidales bacterium]|nr:DUF4159 domain-containing protein [Candidatus Latescibacterota bacterium]
MDGKRFQMRDFIVFCAAAVLLLLPTAAGAQGHRPSGGAASGDAVTEEPDRLLEDTRIRVGRLKYGGGGDWYSDPSSLPNLLAEFSRRTGIPTATTEKVIGPGAPELYTCPFLYLTGHGNIRLTGQEISRLRKHLLNGGFLYADDNYGMDKSFRSLVRVLFPERDLVMVPSGHPVYHSFYDMEGPPKIHEHDGKPPMGFGIFQGDRLMLFYTYESDIGDGLEDPDVHGDPPGKREQAIRMAVNVLYYALTR